MPTVIPAPVRCFRQLGADSAPEIDRSGEEVQSGGFNRQWSMRLVGRSSCLNTGRRCYHGVPSAD